MTGLAAELQIAQDVKLAILGVHVSTPYSAQTYELRSKQFAQIEDFATSTSIPLLVAGDFNSTPWSLTFKQLLENTALSAASSTRLPLPTWRIRSLPIFFAQIDNVLYSDKLCVKRLNTLPDVGSDHWPLVANFAVRRQ